MGSLYSSGETELQIMIMGKAPECHFSRVSDSATNWLNIWFLRRRWRWQFRASAKMNSTLLLQKFLPTRGWGAPSSYVCKSSSRQAWSIRVFASSPASSDQTDTIPSIYRKVIWFHHIKSSKKKKHIVEWGKELRLGGYCKPGFPGILIFEGEGENVEDYLKRIKRLRWQHLQVRGGEEEQLPSKDEQSVDSLRRFPMGIKELPESGMSELAEKCRDANLEQLFLSALKISR